MNKESNFQLLRISLKDLTEIQTSFDSYNTVQEAQDSLRFQLSLEKEPSNFLYLVCNRKKEIKHIHIENNPFLNYSIYFKSIDCIEELKGKDANSLSSYISFKLNVIE